MRIPVFVSHSEAVHVETREPITPERARELFAAVPGVVVQDDPATHDYPLATEAAGRDEIFVGRVRRDISIADDRGIAFWVVSDNLRKGAATNAVELAEALRERDWIKPAAARGAKPFAASDRGHGVTDVERQTALEEIAAEVRVCTNCRLHQTRTKAVPGEGDPDTEVVFVGEGPGFNEDREGRPFIGRAGDLLVKLIGLDRLAARGRLHHERRQVPAARTTATRSPTRSRPARRSCAASSRCSIRPSSSRSAGSRWPRSCPARGSAQAHGTSGRSIPRRAPGAVAFAMYHPAAALRTPAIERERTPTSPRSRPHSSTHAGAARRRRHADTSLD